MIDAYRRSSDRTRERAKKARESVRKTDALRRESVIKRNDRRERMIFLEQASSEAKNKTVVALVHLSLA